MKKMMLTTAFAMLLLFKVVFAATPCPLKIYGFTRNADMWRGTYVQLETKNAAEKPITLVEIRVELLNTSTSVKREEIMGLSLKEPLTPDKKKKRLLFRFNAPETSAATFVEIIKLFYSDGTWWTKKEEEQSFTKEQIEVKFKEISDRVALKGY